jgi:hypothetical protein
MRMSGSSVVNDRTVNLCENSKELFFEQFLIFSLGEKEDHCSSIGTSHLINPFECDMVGTTLQSIQ